MNVNLFEEITFQENEALGSGEDPTFVDGRPEGVGHTHNRTALHPYTALVPINLSNLIWFRVDNCAIEYNEKVCMESTTLTSKSLSFQCSMILAAICLSE